MTQRSQHGGVFRLVRAGVVLLALVIVVALLMLWLVGAFRAKVATTGQGMEPIGRPVGDAAVVEVIRKSIPLNETAVGTVEPVHRIEVASRLLSRVVEVNVTAGQSVKKDDVLVRLDDTDLKARQAQAEAGVAQAQAALDQATIEESRVRSAREKNAASTIEMEAATNALKAARANLERNRQALVEAETILEYATIRSPIDGTVVDKRINSGDTVTPGQVVVVLLDPTRMQLVASVRESLSQLLSVGSPVSVQLDVLDHACTGTVSEIVPEAESASRTFLVKVTGPCPPGVYAGMFGRLIIPTGTETVLLIPTSAVQHVGQLQCVDVVTDGKRERRAVRLGRTFGDHVEALAGLSAGEEIIANATDVNESAAGR